MLQNKNAQSEKSICELTELSCANKESKTTPLHGQNSVETLQYNATTDGLAFEFAAAAAVINTSRFFSRDNHNERTQNTRESDAPVQDAPTVCNRETNWLGSSIPATQRNATGFLDCSELSFDTHNWRRSAVRPKANLDEIKYRNSI